HALPRLFVIRNLQIIIRSTSAIFTPILSKVIAIIIQIMLVSQGVVVYYGFWGFGDSSSSCLRMRRVEELKAPYLASGAVPRDDHDRRSQHSREKEWLTRNHGGYASMMCGRWCDDTCPCDIHRDTGKSLQSGMSVFLLPRYCHCNTGVPIRC